MSWLNYFTINVYINFLNVHGLKGMCWKGYIHFLFSLLRVPLKKLCFWYLEKPNEMTSIKKIT